MILKKSMQQQVLPLSLLSLITSVFSVTDAHVTKQNGVAFCAWGRGDYQHPEADLSLEMLAATGANWICLQVTGTQETYADTTIYYLEEELPSDEDYVHAIEKAQDLGLRVMLKPSVDLTNDPYHWRGDIGDAFHTEVEWNGWFNSYRNYIFHFAELAQIHRIDQFCIGCELTGVATERADKWREIAAGVRERFSGPIVYAANHSGEEVTIGWWDAVDFIGVDAYYPLTGMNDPTVDELKAGWTPRLNTLSQLSKTWGKPILFVEIGYPSQDGANRRPWDSEQSNVLDLQEQADCYEAFFETVYNQSFFAGMFWWAWLSDPFNGGPCNVEHSPHDKPAEDVLRAWFGASPREPWITSPSDTSWKTYIYQDELGPGWREWWSEGSTFDFSATDRVYKGAGSIKFMCDPGGMLRLRVFPALKTGAKDFLEFYVIGSPAGSSLEMWFGDESGSEYYERWVNDCRYIEGGTIDSQDWKRVFLPLKHLFAADTTVAELVFKDVAGEAPTFWLDELRILGYRPQPPQFVSAEEATAYEDSFFAYSAKAIDPEDSLVAYTFHHYPGWLTPGDSTISGIPREGATDTSFVVIASDGQLTDTLKVEVTVIPINDPPRIINISDITFSNTETYIIHLDTCVIDEDHPLASLEWEITPFDANVMVVLADNIAEFSAPDWIGETEVQFKVTDPQDAPDSVTVSITVIHPSRVDDFQNPVPKDFCLEQNYPNPFNPTTSIQYSVVSDQSLPHVILTIYNPLGQEVRTLVDKPKKAGHYTVIWDGKDASGRAVGSGVYFCRFSAGTFTATKAMVLMK